MPSDNEAVIRYQVGRNDVIEQMFSLTLPMIFRILLVFIALAGVFLLFFGSNRWIAAGIALFPIVFLSRVQPGSKTV